MLIIVYQTPKKIKVEPEDSSHIEVHPLSGKMHGQKSFELSVAPISTTPIEGEPADLDFDTFRTQCQEKCKSLIYVLNLPLIIL